MVNSEADGPAENHAIASKQGKPFIGNRFVAPEYVLDSEEIINGYRINFTTHRDVFRSMFLVHNETVNIWTHYCGFLLFAWVAYYLVINVAPNSFHTHPETDLMSRWTEDIDGSLAVSRQLLNE